MPDLRERWRTSFIEATTYDWAIEHEHIAGVLARLAWGTDTAAFYRDIARLCKLPTSTKVLDIPCGGGVAFRGLRPERELDYLAADLSPVMLRRARAEADRRGLHWIEFVEADVEALPFAERSFDLVITYAGLHCFPDPSAAISEMARVLRPGGERGRAGDMAARSDAVGHSPAELHPCGSYARTRRAADAERRKPSGPDDSSLGVPALAGRAACSFGAVHRTLGGLAGLLGREADAVRHLGDAIQLNDALGAAVWRARADRDLAGTVGREPLVG